MKTKLTAIIASSALIAAFTLTSSAQFPISIPKLPKIKKDKPEAPAPNPSPTEKSTPASPSVTHAPSPTTPATVSPATDGASAAVLDERCTRGAYGVWRDDMETTRKEAAEYKPGLRDYYVQNFNDKRNEYLWQAISPKERKELLDKIPPQDHPCFVPILDAIAAAAKTTLSTYRPTGYGTATPAEQRLLRAAVEDIEKATVFMVGLESGAWNIEKNGYGIPTARYRYGVIWLKWPGADDSYCRAYYVNLVQDYSGGGTYSQSYGRYANVEPVGCPAGK